MLDKTLLRQRLAFIRQGSEVERYHTKRMIQRNDIGHHSFHVAWIAYLLALGYGTLENVNATNVVMAALAHDLGEHVTGDMPGDAKREMQLRPTFADYEAKLMAEVGLAFDDRLSETEKRIVKLADMMDGAFFCISEASLGNARVGVVFRNFRLYIAAFAPFNDTEAEIVAYIDELWAHYGADDSPGWSKTAHSDRSRKEETIMGQDKDDWGEFAQREKTERFPLVSSRLVDALRTEEAEGRATPSPSKAAQPLVTQVPEQASNDAVDEPAQRDLAAPPSMPANARQHGGNHYKDVGYEHWDLVLDTGMDYFQGCATKYVTRARKHSKASAEENLLKSIHYVDKVQESEAAGRIKDSGHIPGTMAMMADFKAANQLTDQEMLAIRYIISREWDAARKVLQDLLGQLHGAAA